MINIKLRFKSLNGLEQWAETNKMTFYKGAVKVFYSRLKIKLYKYVIRRPELQYFL